MTAGEVDSEQLLPIDITYSKLSDWLEDRHKIPSDWRKRLSAIRSRINKALQVLPRDLDPSFVTLTPENTGYFEVQHARDILLKLTPESRNFFGRLSGMVGEWSGIVHAYEKDSLYLGECAQLMVQYVTYEIPLHKKHMTRVQQQLADLDRKEVEFKRNAAISASKYMQACQELGIQGRNVKSELLDTTKVLPSLFENVVKEVCSTLVGQASHFYQAFVDYAHSGKGCESKPVLPAISKLRDQPPHVEDLSGKDNAEIAGDDSLIKNCVHTLKEEDDRSVLLHAGSLETSEFSQCDSEKQTEVYDFQTSRPEPCTDLNESLEDTLTDIETGEKDGVDGDLSEILWDVDLEADTVPDSEENVTGDPSEIDWNIEIEENASERGVLLQGVQEKNSLELGRDNQLAQEILGEFSVFADFKYRNKLLDDLYELAAFINQRAEAMKSSEISALQSQVQAVAPSALQQFGSDSLIAMATELSKILDMLTNRRTRDLLMIITSSRHKFLDRLEASLVEIKKNETKLLESLEDLVKKRLELRNTLSSIWPKQEAAIRRIRQVKRFVEDTLSAQYEKRSVNIIGEINILLGHG